MKPDKVLVFDVYADYGFIKKNYTTMSPLSFPILTRTAIGGMIGAITGVDKKENPEKYIDNCLIAQRVLNPVKKVSIPQNLLKTTSRKHFARFDQHKPTNIEFLKEIKIRLYFYHEDEEFYDLLKKQLSGHKSYYTLSIGISQGLANYYYRGEQQVTEKKRKSWIVIDSVIPVDAIVDIQFDENELFTVNMPNKMKNDREVVEFREFLFDRTGAPVTVKIDKYLQLSEGEIIVPM